MKIVAISAGLGEPSSTQLLGERLLKAAGADQVHHVELRLLAHDLVNSLLTRMQSPALEQVITEVVEADALIVVSPVYNASVSGLFKMFFDVLHEGALLDKPVLLAATGGTPRHSLAIDQAMLPLFFYLKAAVAPTAVFAATDDWGDAGSGLDGRIERAGRELAAMVRVRRGESLGDVVDAPQERRERTVTADDFTVTKSFEEMFNAI
ncbi:MsuE subfamily FMN reductase [Luteococcus japonicus]|uniref:MsuE subfamily FMN reductase n=1 Tax=Luteococcus japonicus TaxID=33984 RepID=A0A3N1ZVM6_9ACTN|nr:CE1759 family FMN reductase [Luteococcus japonicus]ROR54879.1 MsuE subfamily FMN reductase [Luteococcus japonicus]